MCKAQKTFSISMFVEEIWVNHCWVILTHMQSNHHVAYGTNQVFEVLDTKKTAGDGCFFSSLKELSSLQPAVITLWLKMIGFHLFKWPVDHNCYLARPPKVTIFCDPSMSDKLACVCTRVIRRRFSSSQQNSTGEPSHKKMAVPHWELWMHFYESFAQHLDQSTKFWTLHHLK